MNLIRFLRDYFHVDGPGNSAVKAAEGQLYPSTGESQSQVAAGAAEVLPLGAPAASPAVVEGASESAPSTAVTTV